MNKDFAVPEFLGRTCNLMFQTAAAIGYAKKYGTDWFIPPHYHHRQIYKYWKLPVYKGNIRKLKVYDVATDEGWGYSPIPKFEGGVKLRGFFQSERHFDNAVPEVKQAFLLAIDPIDFVSIHIRRGDYMDANQQTFRPVDMNYIHQAVDVFRQYNKMKFLVFSDDIAWCKANLSVIKDAEFHYSEGQSEFGDLSRMASCSDHIIANSSFSWWGAYLGSNENKLVVSPDHTAPNWFAHNKMDTTHLIPSSWTEIKFR
jgi:hypothetical protein